MPKIKVKISETKYSSIYKTLVLPVLPEECKEKNGSKCAAQMRRTKPADFSRKHFEIRMKYKLVAIEFYRAQENMFEGQ